MLKRIHLFLRKFVSSAFFSFLPKKWNEYALMKFFLMLTDAQPTKAKHIPATQNRNFPKPPKSKPFLDLSLKCNNFVFVCMSD